MIDDIVVLPRTLKQFKREASVSSETMVTLPLSAIPRYSGFESPNDEDWVCFGSTMRVPTGKHTWFRFKIVENTPIGIVEYFCLTESPVDFYNPRKSIKLKIHCPWLTITDSRHLKVKKFVLWRHIIELTRYETEDSVIDSPVEAVIANEIRAFAQIYGCEHFYKELTHYPTDFKNVLVSELKSKSEEDGLDTLCTLESNIRAYLQNDDDLPFPMFEPDDIWRGISLPKRWTNTDMLRYCSVLPFLQFGAITLGEIAHLFSPCYQLHAFQRGFAQPVLNEMTILNIPANDTTELFTIIKYAEGLPYSEFELRITKTDCGLKVYNPYDLRLLKKTASVEASQSTAETDNIRRLILERFPNLSQMLLVRSWSEEIYITVTYADGKTDMFYYDMSVAALCDRSLIRDYNGCMFAQLI